MTSMAKRVQPIENLFMRLNGLAVSRFGCTVEYIHFTELKEEHRYLHSALLKEGSLEGMGVLYLPVVVAQRCTGAAKISGDIPQEPERRQQLIDLLDLILVTSLELQSRIDILDRLEACTRRLDNQTKDYDNVIPLARPVLTDRDWLPSIFPTTEKFATTSRPAPSVPCLIESLSFSDIKRLAQDLHDLSGRYAFVCLSDLNINHAHELFELGAVTLFIPDITALSAGQQEILRVYLSSPSQGTTGPQIIAGTIWPQTELREKKGVNADLLRRISVGYLRMSRPYEEYRREGIFDFFFSSLLT